MQVAHRPAFSYLFIAALLASPAGFAGQPDPASLVNPLVGTTNGGNVFPGATMPFGMVQFSPEATPVNLKRMIAAPGGYEYRATQIRGFSLTNVEGWGCAGASGDVPFMPTTEAITESPSKDFRHTYAENFTHADEKAEPGSYQVKLGNGVQVALAAATRMGAATFTFPAGQPARILVRTSDSEVGSTAAQSKIDGSAGLVTGSVTSGNFCGYIGTEDRRPYYTLYFVARFDRPITETGAWRTRGSCPARPHRKAPPASALKDFLKPATARASGLASAQAAKSACASASRMSAKPMPEPISKPNPPPPAPTSMSLPALARHGTSSSARSRSKAAQTSNAVSSPPPSTTPP
jgi:putative alpha-1,2-mannosidase